MYDLVEGSVVFIGRPPCLANIEVSMIFYHPISMCNLGHFINTVVDFKPLQYVQYLRHDKLKPLR